MMGEKNIAIVLGGTNPHIAVIENLKGRGYYTVLIDYLENPPAKKVADEHILESTLDAERVFEVAKRLGAQLIISACIDQAIVTACKVSDSLGLPTLYDYETAKNVTDKSLMKRKMIEEGIPTSGFIFINQVADFQTSGLKFPVMVKPVDNWGSTGVKKADNLDELDDYLNEALRISRVDRAIVEEYKTGKEISVYCFVKDKIPHIVMMSERYNVSEGKKKAIKCYATLAPVEITENNKAKIQDIANRIVKSFNLENTPLHIQVFVNDDEVSVIEIAGRIAAGLSYRTIKMTTGFDMLDATLDLYCGDEVKINYSQEPGLIAVNLIYALPGVLGNLFVNENLIEQGVIEEYYTYKTKGMDIGDDMSNRTRVGAFIVKANNKTELVEKIKTAMDNMEVYDINGTPIMRRDLHIN